MPGDPHFSFNRSVPLPILYLLTNKFWTLEDFFARTSLSGIHWSFKIFLRAHLNNLSLTAISIVEHSSAIIPIQLVIKYFSFLLISRFSFLLFALMCSRSFLLFLPSVSFPCNSSYNFSSMFFVPLCSNEFSIGFCCFPFLISVL